MIRSAFIQYRQWLVNYVCKQVGDYAEAENIVQSAFLRLLEMQVGVREESVKNLLFTTCSRLACDWLRHKQVKNRVDIYTYMYAREDESTEQAIRVHELEEQELKVVNRLSAQCRAVYCLSRFEGKDVHEIATAVNNIAAGENVIVSTEWYSLTGTRLPAPVQGVCIRTQRMADGSVVSKKVLFK